jgi:hypothetical protein
MSLVNVNADESKNVREFDATKYRGDPNDAKYNTLCSFPGCPRATAFVFRDYVNVNSSFYDQNIRKNKKIYTKFSLTACKTHLDAVNDIYFG